MRIAVVDDERPARSELVYLIRQCSPEAEITEAESSDRLMQLLDTEEFDVCFVDIDLGGANGTTLASMIKSKLPEAQIIFATAYREYAVKAFELGATDYLLKPFDLDRVRKTMGRLEERRVEAAGAREMAINKIMVNAGASFQVLDVADIVFIETEKRSCKIHTAKKAYLQNESLNYYETRLRNCRFFRIHKSYLVNLDYVLEMIPTYNSGYSLKMRYYEKELLPIGRTQVKEFRQLFSR
ncbi:LytTR family DNA-binding domain-containing protein [[Clostridium] symbiosum]|uniref:LytR/AlgR family response regulator transcription factor n=1 Tax=Clostridium symbiosum TaxID=1512 RepID=UPI001D095650|nr:LytTR family DNA-binding domain-containing protein [[Clostridium] symbiosum]MCB6609205.1 LytTR family DNA-binding domain-containing protein [[Clostridium] symbiosum]MCB6933070.1 LytTR family DNA-binding domain-containing protein [[Clostridium] symbiosum]